MGEPSSDCSRTLSWKEKASSCLMMPGVGLGSRIHCCPDVIETKDWPAAGRWGLEGSQMGLSSRVSMWPVCKFPWPGKTLVDAEVVWKRG